MNKFILSSAFVDLSGYFSNLHMRMKHVVKRLLTAQPVENSASGRSEIVDSRGPVVRNPQKVQTFLTPEKIDEMLTRYAAGEGVKTLAQEYGVHRNTIWRHAVKRGIVTESRQIV